MDTNLVWNKKISVAFESFWMITGEPADDQIHSCIPDSDQNLCEQQIDDSICIYNSN